MLKTKRLLGAVIGSLIVCYTAISLLHAAGDTDPPHLISIDFTPKKVNVAVSDQIISFTAHFTDDLSGLTDGEIGGIGVSPTQARFRSPSGGQYRDVIFRPPADLVSGSQQDGIYESAMLLPRYSEAGSWKLEYLMMSDDVGNRQTFYLIDMSALFFPTGFLVFEKTYSVYVPLVIK